MPFMDTFQKIDRAAGLLRGIEVALDLKFGPEGLELMPEIREIRDHSNEVNARMGRVGEWYRFQGDREWRYERSELFGRWQDLRRDIRDTASDLLDRR